MPIRPKTSATPGEKLRLVNEFYELALWHKRRQLRERNPALGEPEIEELLTIWLRERRGAENGDSDGRPIEWPRRKG